MKEEEEGKFSVKAKTNKRNEDEKKPQQTYFQFCLRNNRCVCE